MKELVGFDILYLKLFWTTVRKKCSSDQKKKQCNFKAEGWEVAKFWDQYSVQQFIQ